MDLRSRRRLQVRRDVAEKAARLFAERGYEHVTVAEIAAAAGISRRTFFTHFASKEEAALASAADVLESLQRSLSAKKSEISFTSVVRDNVSELIAWHEHHAELLEQRRRIALSNPDLAAKVAAARTQAERDMVTPHLAAELGLPPEHHTVMLVVGAFTGLGDVLMSRAPDLLPADVATLADEALDLFEALLLRVKQTLPGTSI